MITRLGESYKIKTYFAFIWSLSILISCAPQAATLEATATPPASTQTSIPPTATITFTPLPTETAVPSATLPPTTLPCAMPINPIDQATIPAQGPFDFTWTPFEGAVSYIISIGPPNWFPTNFPVHGTTLTRYMESFPSSPSYEWSISAINAAGQEICKTGPYTFVTSADLSATPSFVTNNIPITQSGNNPPNNSSNSSGSNQTSSGRSSSDRPTFSDISFMIQGDSDTQDCRLGVSYQVKSNEEFVFIKLIYQTEGGVEGSVDLVPDSREPYPAYNTYRALTEPLPVQNGETVRFGIWDKTVSGSQDRGLTLLHSMTNCNQ